jgi:predicted GNAT family acetyltransferase
MTPPTVRLARYETGPSLLARAEDFLARDPAGNSLLLGICTGLTTVADDPAQRAYLVTVEDAAGIVAAAVRTPPHALVLSPAPPEALEAIVADLHARGVVLPAAVGPAGTVELFAERWAQRSGVRARVAMRQNTFVLTAVIPPAPVAGALRVATEEDLEVLVSWSEAFVDETGLPASDRAFARREVLAQRIAAQSIFVWCEGERPVSMAMSTARTAHGARIGWVYTPPALRGRGYASACVAALSQRLLDSGLRFVFLNTDAANPTSNKIYQALGYRPAGDSVLIAFERTAEGRPG